MSHRLWVRDQDGFRGTRCVMEAEKRIKPRMIPSDKCTDGCRFCPINLSVVHLYLTSVRRYAEWARPHPTTPPLPAAGRATGAFCPVPAFASRPSAASCQDQGIAVIRCARSAYFGRHGRSKASGVAFQVESAWSPRAPRSGRRAAGHLNTGPYCGYTGRARSTGGAAVRPWPVP